jgi:ParB/RepB/Spo0J family partition protein
MGQLFDLTDSMSQVGQLAPIIVNRVDGKNILVAGERRLRAAMEGKMAFVEAKVFENLDVVTALRMTLAENKYKPLNPIEEAKGMQMLIDVGKYNVKKIAREFNIAPETVERKLKLLKLPDDIQKMMNREENKLPVHQAIQISKLPEDKMRIAAREIAPSTGPVMNEEQTKQYIEETFKPKGPKLDLKNNEPVEADPADRHPTLPGPDKKKTPAKKVKAADRLKPVPANLGIKGRLIINDEGRIIVDRITLTVKVDAEVKIVKLDNHMLMPELGMDDIYKLIKKHQPDKKGATKKDDKKPETDSACGAQ